MVNEVIGRNIKYCRKKRKINQKDLAKRVGICNYTLIKIEKGYLPIKPTLQEIQYVLGLCDAELFEGTDASYETIYANGIQAGHHITKRQNPVFVEKGKPLSYSYDSVAELLSREINKRGYKEYELAALTGLSEHTIHRIMHNEYDDSATVLKHAHLICRCVNIPYELITYTMDAMFDETSCKRIKLMQDIIAELNNYETGKLLIIKERLKNEQSN